MIYHTTLWYTTLYYTILYYTIYYESSAPLQAGPANPQAKHLLDFQGLDSVRFSISRGWNS